jgi:hypothetical protein
LSIDTDSGCFKEEMSTVGDSNVYALNRASMDKLTGSDWICGKGEATRKIVEGPQRYDEQGNRRADQSRCHFTNRAVTPGDRDQINSFTEELQRQTCNRSIGLDHQLLPKTARLGKLAPDCQTGRSIAVSTGWILDKGNLRKASHVSPSVRSSPAKKTHGPPAEP